jgi:ATP-dependent DNA helicase RecG
MSDLEVVEKLLNIPEETQEIEFKRLNGPKVVQKILETTVAMANTNGGSIVIGIDDPEKTTRKGLGRVYGIEENLELYDELIRNFQTIIPPISSITRPVELKVNVSSNLNVEDTKRVAIINIPKATECFHSFGNQVYVRLNKGNKRLTPAEVIKLSYAKGFEKADKELVRVDFTLLDTQWYQAWKQARSISGSSIEDILFRTGLARKNDEGKLLPTRAAVLLFAEYPTNLMDTKCTVRILQYTGRIETFRETPNLIGNPVTVEGPLIELIAHAQDYVLTLLRTGVEIHSGFITKYQIPERAIKEAITNAVIHRDYHIKRDIEIKIFEDRVEIKSPGLFPYNITTSNIGKVRSDGYRNDLLVKHLREFPEPPNLDQNEGVKAMQNEMNAHNLYPPIYWEYPTYQDSVEVGLFNELRPGEWEQVRDFLIKNKYINNVQARTVTGIVQAYKMSALFRRWADQGLLIRIQPTSGAKRNTRYKLANQDELGSR